MFCMKPMRVAVGTMPPFLMAGTTITLTASLA
jgi:hypothetical protein